MTINVRFAPSPTGLLHIGNIRAALFNFLFARKNGGSFMLRLDDTDQQRSTPAFEEALIRDLKWLGFSWDSFAKQSDRTARYEEVLEQLKAKGRVYPCFETQAELDLKRKSQLGRGLPPIYDRAALKLTEEEKAKLIADGVKPHWRFKLEDRETSWDDMIQKHKSFPAGAVSDPVLIRADGVPLYTYCSMVDDIDFNITHIIRGEDHVTNTAVQIQIWNAITDKPAPIFAHFPLLVSSTGQEMSKRLGTLSVSSLREGAEGYKIEPMAINSLLATLGTAMPTEPHVHIEDLIASFDLMKVSRATAKFDLEELQHLSAKILHMTPFAEIQEKLKANGLPLVDEAFWNAVRPNLVRLDDVKTWWDVAQNAVEPKIEDPAFIQTAAELLPQGPWDATTWGTWTNAVKERTGRKGKDLYHPLRLALTGTDHGPELKTFLPFIGPARAEARLAGKAA